ncbi:MAG: hypothetical protein K5761_01760 [Clostridiales bacterium]|nr:hypothetical protein [Clostridiales bacterium]
MERSNYDLLREKHPSFTYSDYKIEKQKDCIFIEYSFKMENGPEFHPTIKVMTDNLNLVNDYDSVCARKIIFSLGMVELISYWKAACPPKVYVDCGHLDSWDARWWKKLYFNGLGEFHYVNNISAYEEDFMDVICRKEHEGYPIFELNIANSNLIAIGGGKDSAVTTDLLKKYKNRNLFITINDQKAREETVIAGGYDTNRIVRTYRTIDPALLELNAEGYLNGHTPFSAIVAFLSLYCAFLTGSENIVLSNESSANESNVKGMKVNHQYSKSFEFEEDFRKYTEKNILNEIKYFSILRPFNELQIAKYFSKCTQYHDIFRSCNRGSKENKWCGKCSKCLFVFMMLSPFIDYDRLVEIFGSDLLDDVELEEYFDGLLGISGNKPFECVGTSGEISLALYLLNQKTDKDKRPALLRRFIEKIDPSDINKGLLKDYNPSHNVPDEYLSEIMEMYGYVADN